MEKESNMKLNDYELRIIFTALDNYQSDLDNDENPRKILNQICRLVTLKIYKELRERENGGINAKQNIKRIDLQ